MLKITISLSTHNICFGLEIRKLFFCYTQSPDMISYLDLGIHFVVYHLFFVCFLYVLVPVDTFSVMLGQVILGSTSMKQGIKCLAQA